MELDDPVRLAAVEASGVASTGGEQDADEVARSVATLFDAPVGLVTVVWPDRQEFAGMAGLEGIAAAQRGTPLSHSFCRHVVEREEPLVVPDSRQHPLVADNPAIEALGVAAYLGVPVTDDAGNVVAVLCAIDEQPRDWTDEDVARLRALTPTVATRARHYRRGLRPADPVDVVDGRFSAEDFAALVAHDLLNPLSTALGMAESLARPELGVADLRRLAAGQQRTLRRALDLLVHLRDHAGAGRTAFEPRPVDLDGLVVDVLDDLAALVRDAGAEVRHSHGMPVVRGDPVQLRQVLANLVGNAVTHGAGRGGPPTVTVEAELVGDDVLVAVVDDGPGIDADVGSLAFEAGVRGPASGGLGLGLATVRRIVALHDGRTWVEQPAGGGTRVNVLLPAHAEPVRRVLVADGDPVRHQRLADVLGPAVSQAHHRLLPAGTVEEAEQLRRRHAVGEGDLVLLAPDLPGEGIVAATARMVASGADVRVVTTLPGTDPAVEPLLAAGAGLVRSAVVGEDLFSLAERLGAPPIGPV